MKKKVNIAILIGRAGSKGLPGKNTKKILGRFLVEYPLIAAKNSKMIKYLFVSTDCKKIKKISKNYHAINSEILLLGNMRAEKHPHQVLMMLLNALVFLD